MKHPAIRALFDYWNKQRGNRPAPERGEIDPTEIRAVLGDTFILAADFVDRLRFRLAGTRVCALFCREIKGEAFTALWSETSRQPIEAMLASVINENEGAVADIAGRAADGAEVALELLVLPLAQTGHGRIRALGALVPVVRPYWLGEKPVVEIELGALRPVGRRARRGFTVYDGGRMRSAEPRG